MFEHMVANNAEFFANPAATAQGDHAVFLQQFMGQAGRGDAGARRG
jgi:hypothetical protein